LTIVRRKYTRVLELRQRPQPQSALDRFLQKIIRLYVRGCDHRRNPTQTRIQLTDQLAVCPAPPDRGRCFWSFHPKTRSTSATMSLGNTPYERGS
jgi:hypothetical protein